MTPRTKTGAVLERMVLPALKEGGFTAETQVHVGQRFGCGKHFADVVATKLDRKLLISLKWQQFKGTTEQKVPFEVLCLIDAVKNQGFSKAYVVLGGEGWTLREFFVSGGLTDHLKDSHLVEILTLEGFVAKANHGRL